MSTSPESSSGSAPGHLPTTASTPTGTPLGGTGAIAPTSSPVKTALQALDSDQVRREVGALLERRALPLQRVVSKDLDLVGFRAVGELTTEQRDQIRTLSRHLTKPSDRQFVVQEVTRCLSLTKSRAKGDAELALMVTAMTDELVKFPADLVAWSLRKWSGSETFWPSLAEILSPIKREMGWRKSLETAAGTVIPANKPTPKSAWNSLPQDRKDRINEALRKAGISDPIP